MVWVPAEVAEMDAVRWWFESGSGASDPDSRSLSWPGQPRGLLFERDLVELTLWPMSPRVPESFGGRAMDSEPCLAWRA